MTIKEGVIWGLILLVTIVGVAVGVAQATGDIGDAYVPALTAALVLVTVYYATTTARISKASSEAVNIAKNTSLAQIVIQLTTAYSKPEMLAGMQNLKNFQEKYEGDFARVFIQLEQHDLSYYNRLNEDRRRFSHYFNTIFVLLDTEVIDVEFLKKLIRPGIDDQVDFLLGVIEPLEKEMDSNYSSSMFARFQEIYQKRSSVVREASS